MALLVRRLTLALTLTLVACGPRNAPAVAPPEDANAVGDEPSALGPLDGVACVGQIDAPPSGAVPVTDPAVVDPLLERALGESERGSLCMGQVFEARSSITVYRVWNSEKDYTELGTWWSFAPPGESRESYREANAVCEEWSRLDRLVVCELKIGARFVIGPGQSAACETGPSYPKSATNQVYIPNDGRIDEIHVDNCQPSSAWPD